MKDNTKQWVWQIEVTNGDWRDISIDAEPVDRTSYRMPHSHVEKLWTNSLTHDVVVKLVIVAPTRAEAMEQAKTLYDEQVPADMKQRGRGE